MQPGTPIELDIERPVAGGRMLARVGGRVVLVSGAIPGERVLAEIEQSPRAVIYGRTLEVLKRAPARRETQGDSTCGGTVYAHIDYATQLQLKAQVIADAFQRIGRVTLDGPVAIAASPEHGYRMRARLHIRNGQIGFFREGTHDLCSAAVTRQLAAATIRLLDEIER